MAVTSINSTQAFRLTLTGEAEVDPLTGEVHLTSANFAPGGGTAGVFATLDVADAANVGGAFDVNGASTLAAVSCTTLATSGAATVGTTLGVTGATTLAAASCSTLASSGVATLNSLVVTAGASVGTTLAVTGVVTIGAGDITLTPATGTVACTAVTANTLTAFSMFSAGAGAEITVAANGIVSMVLPVYADNVAALAGGLVANNVYRTATGEPRIVV